MKSYIVLPIILLIMSAIGLTATAQKTNDAKERFRIQYMGNIEAGHTFPFENFLRTTTGRITLTTTHGAKLTPYLYTGLGAGAWLTYYSGGMSLNIPLFADIRFTYPSRRFRPFVDLKGGIASSDYRFISPSVGCKFAWGNKGGVYLSFGSTYLTSEYNKNWDGLSARLGFDF